MADQTSLRGGGFPGQPGPGRGDTAGRPAYGSGPANGHGNGNGVVANIAELGNDVLTLAELQAKLAAMDMKECAGKAVMPAVVAVGALGLLMGALPVALLGVADLVAYALNVRAGWGMLITAGVVAVVAATLLFVFGRRLPESFTTFRRSQEELSRNLAWIRTVVVHSGRSFPRSAR